MRYLRDPYGLFRDCRARYGDTFTVHTTGWTVVTCDPASVQAIFTAGPEQYQTLLPPTQRTILGPESMTCQSGSEHLRQRKVLAPPFRGHVMKAFGPAMRERALEALESLAPGRPFVMRDVAMGIALDVILRAIFGLDGDKIESFRRAVREFVESFSSPLFLALALFGLNRGRIGPQGRFLRARDALDRLILHVIESRKASGEPRSDILDHLTRIRHDDGKPMPDSAIRDNLVTSLIAGHETSAVTIAWAMHWATTQDDAARRLAAEIGNLGSDPSAEALASLPYLDAFIAETLRLWPVVPETNRVLGRPMELAGFTLPAGTRIAAATSLVHSREDLYPQPDLFRPERFLDRRYSPSEYFPFGGGERICIGADFARYEAKVVLGTLLARGRFRRVHDGPLAVRRRGFLMGPADGVELVLEARR